MNMEEALDKIEKALRKDGMSGTMSKKICRIMREFATPEGFFTASQGAVLSTYNKLTPDKPYGLGKAFWNAMNRATEIWNNIKEGTIDVDAKHHADDECKEKAYGADPDLFRMLTLEEIKTVVAFMDLCDIEAINILEIIGFLRSVRIRQKKTSVEANAMPSEAQPAEA